MNILVTGGAGYIGSHAVLELLELDNKVTVIDDLSNSSEESLKRVREITGKKITFYDNDLCNKSALENIFKSHSFDAIIHFAGYKSVGESVDQPLKYYRNNLDATLTLCELMKSYGINKIIFSSSATVYGEPSELPLKETSRAGYGITNPYGQTKYMIEQIFKDIAVADPQAHITLLRYFNPVGAHVSGMIGEDPTGIPNNLLPYVAQVALGKLKKVHVFGNDYDTPDGTGVRDYIHVVDLAKGHVAALEKQEKPGVHTYNLGTGAGVSVLDVIHSFEVTSQKKIPYEIVERRPGDVAICYADSSKANHELGWKAEKSFDDACEDTWRWQLNNPDGYR